MTIPALLMRFFLLYTVTLVAAAFAVNAIGLGNSSGINIVVLAAVVFWACMTFGKKNGRDFTKTEMRITMIGFIVIDLLLQLLFGVAVLSQSNAAGNLGAILLGFGFFSLLHIITIIIFVRVASKMLTVTGTIPSK